MSDCKFSGQHECYRTYFRYPQEFADHVKKTGSVKGYQGFAYADWFPVDIDDADLEKALNTTQDLISRIEINFDQDTGMLPVFFSGAKGFHIYIPAKIMGITPSRSIAQIFKTFARDLLEPWGIKYDPAIYDLTRIFRASNTVNSKTGLYKIPLTIAELQTLTADDIRELAKGTRSVEIIEPEENQTLAAMYRRAEEEVNDRPKINSTAVESIGDVPRYAKLCYHELLKGTGEGIRDKSAYRLATHFCRQGFTADITEGLLQSWNKRNTPPLPPATITAKVRSAYGENARNDFGCNDEVLRQFCRPGCYLKTRKEEAGASIVYSFDEAAAAYERYAKNLTVKSCQIGIPVIGPAIRGIAPGEVMTIIARSGVGKTAMLINLLMRIGLSNHSPQMFFTMEQPVPQIYERMAQMALKMTGGEVEKAYTEAGMTDKRQLIKESTRALFERILLVDKDFLSVDQMMNIVKIAEEQKIGRKINIIAIDYLGRMGGRGKDSYAILSENAQAIKHMAKELDVAVISLAQVNRKGGAGTEELSMDMIRDSGQVEEASDFILGMWRPDMKENEAKPEDKLRIKILKNRKGPAGIVHDLKFLKKWLRVDDYNESMWMDLAENDREGKNCSLNYGFFGQVIEYA